MKNYLSLLLLPCLFLISCGDDPASPPTGNSFTHAKPGSSFTYEHYSIDSTGAIIAGSRDTSVSTVIRTDGTMGGRSGVMVVGEKRGTTIDTGYFVYESNNDLTMLANPGSIEPPIWMTLPTGSGTGSATGSADSVEALGIWTVSHDSTLISRAGTENVTVMGNTLPATKILLRFRHLITAEGATVIDSKVDNYFHYAPSLGMMVKTSSPSRPDPFGGWIDGSAQNLIAYSVK